MPDLFDLLGRWWKQIVALVFIAVLVALAVVFSMGKRYLGVATALPAPPYTSDKTAVFGQNLQELYSALGTPDDLDKIVGTAHLDTVYIAVAKELHLASHYGFADDGMESAQKAAYLLKRRTRVLKTDYGELQVRSWDNDKSVAASMANGIIEELQRIYQDVQTANNRIMLSRINNELDSSKTEYQRIHDTVAHIESASATAQILASRQTSLMQRIQEYEKLSNQYKLMIEARPQSLIVVEKARPPLYADEPKPVLTIALAAILSLFFGLLAAVILERRRTNRV